MEENNEVFTTPVPSLVALNAALVDFSDAAAKAAFHDRQAISVRREKRVELEYVIIELSKYVDTIAKGDEKTIFSAGFVPSKIRNDTVQTNPKPLNLRVKPAGLGASRIIAKLAPWKKSRYYQFEYRIKGVDMEWEKVLSTGSLLEINGLEPFREYGFRATIW